MMPTPGPLEATPATLHSPESTSLGPSPLLTSTIASTRENTFHVYSVDNEGGIAEPCSSGDDGGVDAASAVVRGASGGDTGGEGEVKEEEEVENILASRGESEAVRPGSSKSQKRGKKTATTSGKQKAKREAATTKPNPTTRKEQPAPKRTSARLQGHNTPNPSLPSARLARRSSTRYKQGSDGTPTINSTGPTTGSREKPE